MLRASSETASVARDFRVERKIFPDVCISCFVVLVFDISLADCRSLLPMCVLCVPVPVFVHVHVHVHVHVYVYGPAQEGTNEARGEKGLHLLPASPERLRDSFSTDVWEQSRVVLRASCLNE